MLPIATQLGPNGLVEALFMPGMLESIGLFMTRTGALLLLTPLIGSGASFQGYKIALVVSVSAAMFLAQGLPPVIVTSPVELALHIGREMTLGFALAFVPPPRPDGDAGGLRADRERDGLQHGELCRPEHR